MRWLGQQREDFSSKNSVPISLGIYVNLCDFVCVCHLYKSVCPYLRAQENRPRETCVPIHSSVHFNQIK